MVGTIFLLVLPSLPWVPSKLLEFSRNFDAAGLSITYYFILAFFFVYVAALVGLYSCFISVRVSVWRIAWLVLVPAIIGFSLTVGKFFELPTGPQSMFQTQSSLMQILHWTSLNAWKFPTGFYFLVFALAFISLYVVRVAFDSSSLPLSLPGEFDLATEDETVWTRALLLVFILIGPLFFISGLASYALDPIWKLPLSMANPHATKIAKGILSGLLDAVILAGISFLFLRSRGIIAAKKSLQPPPQFAIIGLVVSVFVCMAAPLAHFLIDRVQWSFHNMGYSAAPKILAYLDFSDFWKPRVLIMVFGAIAEEVVFRGILLPNFIKRCGFNRGIFPLGLAGTATQIIIFIVLLAASS